MKVLFIVSDANARGGTEILAYNLLYRLNAIGVESYLLSRWQYTGKDPKVLSLNKKDFAHWLRLSSNPLNKLLGNKYSDAYFRKVVERIAKAYQVDWIVNHTYDLINVVPVASEFKTAQIFNWSIAGYEQNLKSVVLQKRGVSKCISLFSLKSLIRNWHRNLPRFTRLVLLSEAAKEEMKKVSKQVGIEQIAVIPNPLMKESDSTILSSLNNKNIVFVGRFSQEKGVMRLLHIWKLLVDKLSDYTLSIYGEGHLQKKMEHYICENALPRVKFKGFCSNLQEIYSTADLCLMTSDTEGFGMVLIESMYFGVPCISFDCPVSPKEIIADAGETVACFDEQAYATKVIEMLSNPDKMKHYQQNALQRAKSYYIKEVINKWLHLFRN